MTYNSLPIALNPDPRFLTIVVIGTPEQIEAHIRDQHVRGCVKSYEWSRPQPAPGCPGKVMISLNRAELRPEG